MENKLLGYRNEINEIDEQLMQLLEARFVVTEKVGLYKKKENLPVLDATREAEIIVNLELKLIDKINAKYIIDLWKSLLATSRQQQSDIINQGGVKNEK